MKTLRLNVASVSKSIPPSDLERFARQADSVPVFSTAHGAGRVVGKTIAYEWTAPDLWALAELEEDVAEFYQATRAHCEAIVEFGLANTLRAVVITNYSRGFLERVLGSMRGKEAS